MSDLRPASELAKQFGVKCVLYGDPGTGKTPLTMTAPRPVLLATEPGMLTMKNSGDSIPTFEAYEDREDKSKAPRRICEFFDWVFRSNEAKNFDTICIDSASQLAEAFLSEELKRNKHGLKAYGEMARRVLDLLTGLYYLPNKHVYLIAKQDVLNENGVTSKRPYFPGRDLNIKVPHMYDEILHIGEAPVPGQPKPVVAIRTASTFGIVARDRSCNLAEFEPPHLGNLFNKCMS